MEVDDAALSAGECYSAIFTGSTAAHNSSIVSSPSAPGVKTLPVTELSDGHVTFNGLVNAAGGAASVVFEYGVDTKYGSSIASQPARVDGNAATAVTARVADLLPGTTIHYRVRATEGWDDDRGHGSFGRSGCRFAGPF